MYFSIFYFGVVILCCYSCIFPNYQPGLQEGGDIFLVLELVIFCWLMLYLCSMPRVPPLLGSTAHTQLMTTGDWRVWRC